jgi:hypothetical protein
MLSNSLLLSLLLLLLLSLRTRIWDPDAFPERLL